ncbi:hypothetical protein BCR41DRAFT_353279 [Lobosporangium transversale]|uniref:Uncharacterized protein n=1 Tax=Lobosporangium transversale TaxID=64571 RepID=A0A1Y2GT83_9FUNG|nr:hypothetical protein BCR41DRAFT_353279 [Lobosporangium transversale]ORZ16845.1 hypothetical protein BCR41DRAFT_353279 [Lobosporangium transversale]|eukprot:XP_021881780.1 hypothetical protein BCR41DRAFT_353279 [Lobosporangium transversale]
MKNMITSTTILSRKLQRRVDQVIIGREKQAAKMKVVRAKEQAYDQAVAAVHTSTSTSSHPQWSGSSSSPSKPISPLMANAQSQDHPLALLGSTGSKSLELDINASSSAARLPPPSPPPPSAGLPFPLPAKPAFPVISTMRSSNRSESPPLSISPHFSPLLLGRTTATAASPGRDFANSPTSSLTGGNDSDVQQQQLSERVDRFPQISSTAQDDEASKNLSTQFASEVEVVRLRRKKKLSKSSANTSNSSIVSVSTTASVKRSQSVKSKGKGAAKITTTKSTLSVQQAEPSQ